MFVYIGLGCWFGGPADYVVVGYCTGFAAYYVVGGAVVGGFKVCSCFMNVCWIDLIVLFCKLVVAYCFSCDNFVIAVPGYVLVGFGCCWFVQ